MKFPQKLECLCVCECVDGLMLWTGGHLHIRCNSHYFMFFSANCASQHSSMFSSICLLSIDQPSRASVCLTSATSSSSSGNYAARLYLLLIFVSTCRNICFDMSFVSANSLGFFSTSCPLSLTLTKRFNSWTPVQTSVCVPLTMKRKLTIPTAKATLV